MTTQARVCHSIAENEELVEGGNRWEFKVELDCWASLSLRCLRSWQRVYCRSTCVIISSKVISRHCCFLLHFLTSLHLMFRIESTFMLFWFNFFHVVWRCEIFECFYCFASLVSERLKKLELFQIFSENTFAKVFSCFPCWATHTYFEHEQMIPSFLGEIPQCSKFRQHEG